MNTHKITVSEYLVLRMKQIGMSHLFGVPGNFIAPLLNTIEVDGSHDRLQLVNCTNENIAGYAADGFASVGGTKAPAGLFVTAGVGSLSAANAIAGSFMEKVPVLVLNGVFTFNQRRRHELTGVLSSHMLHNASSEETVMREICCDTQVITSAKTAPSQIDVALEKMIALSQPAYIEIAEDVLRMDCDIPTAFDWSALLSPRQNSEKKTKQAIAETIKMLGDSDISEQTLIYAGEGIKRFHLQEAFSQLLDATQIKYVTSLLSKSVISEDNPLFLGQFNGEMLTLKSPGSAPSEDEFDNVLEDARQSYTPDNTDALNKQLQSTKTMIQLGVAKVSVHYPDIQPIGQNHIVISQGAAMIGGVFIGNVDMEMYIIGLTRYFVEKGKVQKKEQSVGSDFKVTIERPNDDEVLGYDTFGHSLNHFVNNCSKKFTIVSDAGFVLRTVSNMHIKEEGGFYSQSDWLAIGYSVPSAIGVQKACGNKSRVLVTTGDGAFQETATALSDHIHHGNKPIVLVLNNGIHGVEQFLVNPNPFRSDEFRQEYSDASLNNVNGYNRIPQWDYIKFAESFGAKGLRVSTAGELSEALEAAAKDEAFAYLIHVEMPREAGDQQISCDVPELKQKAIDKAPGAPGRFIGEDEYPAPQWPKW